MFKELFKPHSKAVSFTQLFNYWLPETASAACLIFLPLIVDLLLVAKLKSTVTYSAIGISSNFIHTLVKLAEALSIAGIAIIGRFNGAAKYEDCFKAFVDTLATTSILGLLQLLTIGFGAATFLRWMEAPSDIIGLAKPFLQLHAVAIFFAFVFMAFLSFFKAVKDAKTPFLINLLGMMVFLISDYGLIFGKFGLPQLGYLGSAVASNLRYLVMIVASVVAIKFKPRYQIFLTPLSALKVHWSNVWLLLKLSTPIMIDKTIISVSYIWLAKMVAPMGVCAIACMDTVKNVERLAFIPAMAFAQIVTFVVSNNLGQNDWELAKFNIKRILLLAVAAVSVSLWLACYFSAFLVSMLDLNNAFSASASKILWAVSPLVVFDLVQLILAGALRGAGDVNTVMTVRVIACSVFFFPVSYLIRSFSSFGSEGKIILIYGSFYLTTAIIGIFLMRRLQGQQWHQIKIPGYHDRDITPAIQALNQTKNQQTSRGSQL